MPDRAPPFDPAGLAEGDELMFDDLEGATPATAQPKRVKTGRKAALLVSAEPIIEDVPPAEPVAPGAVDPLPTPGASVTAPIAKRLLVGALALSLFTSTIACVGLLVASRTIAHSDAARAAAEAQTAQLARLPATLETLDRLVTQEQAALAALRQGRAGQPVSAADLQRGLDGLRVVLSQRVTPQDQQIVAVTKAGQAEIVERLGAIADVVDRVHDAQGKGGAVR